MAAVQGFTPFGGGLISSVVASLGDAGAQVVTGIGQPTPGAGGFASFAVNTLLAGTVQATTGYALTQCSRWLKARVSAWTAGAVTVTCIMRPLAR